MERLWKYWLDHIIFWMATIAFHTYTRRYLIEDAGTGQLIMEVVVRNGLLALVIYTNLLVLIPKIFASRQYILYAFLLCTLLVAYALVKHLHDVYLFDEVLQRPGKITFTTNVFYNLSIAIFYLAFSVGLHLSREWYRQRELIRQIEMDRLNTELAYLKSQINPHFLFNSINTIYFKIDKQNHDARETLQIFSNMLRYQLYECNGNEVLIEKEVEYLQNYINLQRMRKDENYSIRFQASADLKGFRIAPLLLICFVENAFKHVSHRAEDNRIDVQLMRDGNQFLFKAYNTHDYKDEQSNGSGIGLKNVKRRLELLYNKRYQLQINRTEEDFLVTLCLSF
jgi:two-component system, LytTR family, sensor kinase